MRFNHVTITAAILTALTTTLGQADPSKLPSQDDPQLGDPALPNLTIDTIHGQSNWIFDVRNDGSAASAPCQIRLTASTGQVWIFPAFSFAPGEVMHLYAPEVADARKCSFTIEADAFNQVAESNEADNTATMRYHE